MQRYSASSIIDAGCGVGGWLKAAHNLGASSLRGFDGPWVDDSQLLIDPTAFTRIRFGSADWPDLGKVDLARSLEVAEHLSLALGQMLVERPCNAAPLALFSAAIPQQGGEGHQNEQWQSWWADVFAAQGYKSSLFLRRLTWTNPELSFQYRQNMVLYVDPARAHH